MSYTQIDEVHYHIRHARECVELARHWRFDDSFEPTEYNECLRESMVALYLDRAKEQLDIAEALYKET